MNYFNKFLLAIVITISALSQMSASMFNELVTSSISKEFANNYSLANDNLTLKNQDSFFSSLLKKDQKFDSQSEYFTNIGYKETDSSKVDWFMIIDGGFIPASSFSISGTENDFALTNPKALELKAYLHYNKVSWTPHTLSYDAKGVSHFNMNLGTFLRKYNFSPDYTENSFPNDIDIWQFGFFGYSFDGWNLTTGLDLLLSNSLYVHWNNISLHKNENHNFEDKRGRYHNLIKFGYSLENAVQLRFSDFLGVSASYEQTNIFPAYLLLQYSLSSSIFALPSYLIKSILPNSSIRPLLAFIVDTGFNYAMHKIQKKKMNWPFNSEAPLSIDNFKVGLSFWIH